MTVSFYKTPFPITYRELWLPEHIRDTHLPPFRGDAHALTLTGAQKRTTADGVQFTGTATSNVNCGAIHNAQAKFAMRFRFRLTQPFAAAVATQYLWGKYIDADNYIRLYLNTADGLLHLKHRSGAADLFDISVGTGTFTALTWYDAYFATGQTIVGGAASDGARLRLNNGAAATNADVTALPNGGDFIIGDYDDPGAGTGFKGTIVDVLGYTDDVTATEETNNYNGSPNYDAVHVYLLDEGRGVTAYDRGSGANNGTLDTACTWAWGQVVQPALSFDGINDYATAPTVNIKEPVTIVWVGKIRAITPSTNAHMIMFVSIDANNFFYNMIGNANGYRTYYAGGGLPQAGYIYTHAFSIDDYMIWIASISSAGLLSVYFQGSLVDKASSSGAITYAPSTCYLSRNPAAASQYGMYKVLLAGFIEGALTDKQVQTYSRWLKDIYNLPISI